MKYFHHSDNMRFMNHSQFTTEDAKCIQNKTAYSFSELYHALSSFGYSEEGNLTIFKLVASILNLGNISFQEKKDNSGTTEIAETSKCYLKNAADLMDISAETLEKALITRNFNKET